MNVENTRRKGADIISDDAAAPGTAQANAALDPAPRHMVNTRVAVRWFAGVWRHNRTTSTVEH